ncbi:DNA polymerase IV [Chitinophaga pinensis]|uniref:DNA polymerase IV n=1 Tax=Chitinophaga pinensis (strain ATCC 43595 / DSM 2588 / LMG 13176 / NBRC 15968 / NCIMB 11800 / UQM 2034) TaxID=485918 RepID=A0A979GBK4_CHIPD|nr:DNA polymerase IV [Chitinophaga pinensis]ACU64272.1 DNA-directed DNA polymerase [Chitinophaga pinensis DSM 2588]
MISLQHRSIAHFDMDSFFVSVECRDDNSLKGKPLLVGGMSDRGVVAACSYEARRYGIHSAMPMKVALKLCPHAIVRRGDVEKYSQISREVTGLIADKAPLYEKSSIDEFYLDLTGMDKFFGSMKWTTELRQYIMRETQLPVSFGLASNKMISKVATNEAKPNGQLEILFGNEKSFLAPMPVEKLPMVGKETASQLRRRGVETVKTLSEIPLSLLEAWLGKNGISLWNKANGIDESPVVPYHEQKSISTENTFHTDTIDMQFIHAELVRMTEKIAFELRQQDKLTGCVTVKIRYSDFETVTKQMTIPYSSSDHVLLEKVKELFTKLYDRRLLIRLIGVRFSHLVHGNHQISLFDDTQEMISLYQAIDNIKNRFGWQYLMRGTNAAPQSKKGDIKQRDIMPYPKVR